MHFPGLFQLILIIVVILIVFGAGKLPNVMGEIGKGIRNLRAGMRDEEQQDEDSDQKLVRHDSPPPTASSKTEDKKDKDSV